MTLKEIIDRLELLAMDIQTDINSDWISKEAAIKGAAQLSQIYTSIANLKMIQGDTDSIALQNIEPC